MNDHSLVIREDNELNDDLSNLEVASLPALLNISPKSPNQSYDWRDHNNSKEVTINIEIFDIQTLNYIFLHIEVICIL